MEKNSRKALSLLLALVMVLSLPIAAAAEEVASGSCGDGVTWELDEDGELTISGSGAMADYSSLSAPWHAYSAVIESVEIDDGVTNIGSYAFSGCMELEDVEISDSVTSIGNDAFAYCTNLERVFIPDSVTSIGASAFGSCTDLTAIAVESGNPAFASMGGVLFTSDGGTLVTCPAGMEDEYTIPDGVTHIGAGAFSGCTDLERVTIPSSVTSIGNNAFQDCYSLESVHYTGSADQWASIDMGAGNGSLTEAELSCALTDPEPDSDDPTHGGTTGGTGGSSGTGGSGTVGGSSEETTGGKGSDFGNITVEDIEAGNDPNAKPGSLPGLGTSPIQGEAVKDTPAVTWFERLDVAKDPTTLYHVMSGEQETPAEAHGVFEGEQYFYLPARSTGSNSGYRINEISCADFDMLDVYASENGGLNSKIFTDEKFYSVPVTAEDRKVDFGKLQPGDMIRTANFNGVYVTSRPRGLDFDNVKAEACEYIAAVFQAFDRDNPQIFWLSGKCRVRIMVATDAATGVKTAYFFLVTADQEGFTMLSPEWQGKGRIEAGIQRREAAIEKILATVTAADTQGKIRQLNKWLTENNQYNTTADLNTIGNEPHECLAALEGGVGQDGPVCDGYARAMKVLCDRLEIPCVLVTGWARRSTNHEPMFHMWNSIQIGNTWYAADITWNDPTVKDFVGAISGRENENFLLVGANTVVYGMAFNVSHVEQNQAAANGVVFNNGPALSTTAFEGFQAFSDVPANAWYQDAVYWAVEMEITAGTSEATFTPDRTCTETEILIFLWRAAGEPASTAQLPFTPTDAWAADALRWAFEEGMIDAAYNQTAPCTRASAAKFIWQAASSPAASGNSFTDAPSGAAYTQAVAWAVEQGITQGTGGSTFSPDKTCTRAEIVTFLYRAYK